MGWIAGTAWVIGQGVVNSPLRIVEPSGYQGDVVHTYGQTADGRHLGLRRKGRRVYRTRAEAFRAQERHAVKRERHQ
ncbi:hypothetical protein EPN42_04610 [bacterium]|nr:MAG: hypothetical protein EPN42_04610 [bacterium]